MVLVRSLYSLLAISFEIGNAIAERQCYALNGTQLGNEYGACNPDAKHSGCCAINGTAGTAELCLSNGLCMATNNEYMGTIWQNGCTDPTGTDPSCPKICSDARSNLDNSVKAPAWNIQTCDFGSYCCRAAGVKKSCCNDTSVLKFKTKSLGTLMLNSTVTNTSTTTSTSTALSSTSAPTSTATQLPVTTTPSSTPSEPTSCSAEIRHTAIVGGTLSGIFSSIIVALLAVIYFLVQREKKQRKLKEHYEEQFATSAWGKYASDMGSKSTDSTADTANESEGKGIEVRYIGRRDT